jgi:hypothetical protein
MNKKTQEALKMMIEWIENAPFEEGSWSAETKETTLSVIKEALEKLAQEPFAYCYVERVGSSDVLTFDDEPHDAVPNTIFSLYTRPLIPLSDEKIIELCPYIDHDLLDVAFHQGARAAEKAHGIGVKDE